MDSFLGGFMGCLWVKNGGFMGCLWWHRVYGLRSVCLWVVYGGILLGGCWVLYALSLSIFFCSLIHIIEKYVCIAILVLVMALSFCWAWCGVEF